MAVELPFSRELQGSSDPS
uniref:Uncharacterized protein n=1 Tax=Anguilla anguilla TaxID=7936 RepID=A0A0E9QEP3_ANGAN